MKKPSEEDLILHFYGEPPEALRPDREVRDRQAAGADPVAQALASDPEARARYEEIARLLESVPHPAVPERSASYGAEVWARLAPRLEAKARSRWWWRSASLAPRQRREGWGEGLFRAPRWALAGGAAALLAIGFAAGRLWPPAPPSGPPTLSAEARQRILSGTVAAHLEGSERLLLEVVNQSASRGIDLEAEREWAGALLATNRLYRRAARDAGQLRVASLLDELEPIFLELAHGEGALAPAVLEGVQRRIEEQDTLFKLRVVSGRLEAAAKTALNRPST